MPFHVSAPLFGRFVRPALCRETETEVRENHHSGTADRTNSPAPSVVRRTGWCPFGECEAGHSKQPKLRVSLALQVRAGPLFEREERAMTKLEHREVRELTEQELTLVTGGAEPTHNSRSPFAQKRTSVKDSHDRYANIEVTYER
jgi:hypothetical protein